MTGFDEKPSNSHMTGDEAGRHEPKSTLQALAVHSVWSRQFRGGENNRFYGLAFDYIAGKFGDPTTYSVLDAGCGSGTKSLELARRGYRVLAIDFSAAVLDLARHEASTLGFADQISFARGDLTDLQIPAASVHRAVCWGVLMHVPDVSSAVAELARIMAPGGLLIVSEGNKRSIQSIGLRWLKRLLRKERAEVIDTPAGIEFWEPTEAGRLMTRQADLRWLIAEFNRNGLDLIERRAGQFTEIYVLLPWRFLRRLVHGFNNLWFRLPRWAGPAYGNLLVLRKRTE